MDELARNIATGGTFGLILGLVVAVYALATDKLRPTARVEADKKQEADRRDANEAILRTERNEAIRLAQSYADQFERALDIIEGRTPT